MNNVKELIRLGLSSLGYLGSCHLNKFNKLYLGNNHTLNDSSTIILNLIAMSISQHRRKYLVLVFNIKSSKGKNFEGRGTASFFAVIKKMQNAGCSAYQSWQPQALYVYWLMQACLLDFSLLEKLGENQRCYMQQVHWSLKFEASLNGDCLEAATIFCMACSILQYRLCHHGQRSYRHRITDYRYLSASTSVSNTSSLSCSYETSSLKTNWFNCTNVEKELSCRMLAASS